MKTLPYGISDFSRLIRKNYYYVDKTRYIELDRAQPPYLFLIRPHRFGKSLFIAMLETYYSIDYIEELMGLWHLLFLFLLPLFPESKNFNHESIILWNIQLLPPDAKELLLCEQNPFHRSVEASEHHP